jgi:hypothetical protein
VALAAGIAASCGGGSSPETPSQPGGSTAIIVTIGLSGVTPKNPVVPLGGRVRFVNSDVQPHYIGSDPHPDHTDCPEINQVALLLPGQSRETGNFVQMQVCGFHDHNNPDLVSLQGTIAAR